MGNQSEERKLLEILKQAMKDLDVLKQMQSALERGLNDMAEQLRHILELLDASHQAMAVPAVNGKARPRPEEGPARALRPEEFAVVPVSDDRAQIRLSNIEFEVNLMDAVVLSLLAWGRPSDDGLVPFKSGALLAYAVRLIEHPERAQDLDDRSFEGLDLTQEVTPGERKVIATRIWRLRGVIRHLGGDEWIQTDRKRGVRLVLRRL